MAVKVPISSPKNLVLNDQTACSRKSLQIHYVSVFLLIDAQVTGVSGFLGTHVVNQLLKDSYRVRG